MKPKSYKLFKEAHLTEEILFWDFTNKGSIHRNSFQYFVNAETTVSHTVCILKFELSWVYSLYFVGQREKECIFNVRISFQNEVFVPRPPGDVWYLKCRYASHLLSPVSPVWSYHLLHYAGGQCWSLHCLTVIDISVFLIIWCAQQNENWHTKLEQREWPKK